MSGVDDIYKNIYLRNACQVNPTTADATQRTAGADPQSSAAVVQGRETRTGDDVQITGQAADPAAQALAAKNKEKQVSETEILNFNKNLTQKDLTDAQRKEALALTNDLLNGNYADASKHYQTLLTAGVITEDLGNVPFKAEMEKVIQQEKANDFADSLNTRENLKGLEAQYKKNKDKTNAELDDEGLEHGHRSYRRANKKLERSAHRQNALQQTYVKGSKYEVELRDEQGNKTGKTQVMDGEAAYNYQKEHDPEFQRKAKTYTLMSDRGLKTAEIIDRKLKDQGKAGIITRDAEGNVTIDVEKAQAFAREYASTTGNRADKNELKQLAADLGVKEKDVKQFLKGINVDYQKDKRWIGITAGVVVGAATTYLAAKTFAHGKTTGGTPDTEKTTIENKVITIIDKNGGKHTDTISNVITELIPGAPGKAVSWLSKVLPGLGIGIPAGVGTAYLVNALVNRDVNIIKKNHTLAEALDDPNLVKNKGNQEIMEQIKKAPVGNYAADSPEAKMIKLAILGQAMGADNNNQGKLNKQELIGALAQIRQCNNNGNTPDLKVDQPGAGEEPGPAPQPEPNVTNVINKTLIDLGDNGFVDLDTGDKLTGEDGETPLTSLTDDETGNTISAEGAKGSAVDFEKLKARGLDPANHPDEKLAPAQSIIAPKISDIEKDPSLQGIEAYKYPISIPFTDATNANDKGKTSNTYRFEKLPADSPLIPKGPDGKPLQGVFYHVVSATDDASGKNIKGNHEEVYILDEVNVSEDREITKKDKDGNTIKYKVPKFDYHMHQYKGYAGSNQSIGDYVKDQNPNYKVKARGARRR